MYVYVYIVYLLVVHGEAPLHKLGTDGLYQREDIHLSLSLCLYVSIYIYIYNYGLCSIPARRT